jgi:hypothetical protein
MSRGVRVTLLFSVSECGLRDIMSRRDSHLPPAYGPIHQKRFQWETKFMPRVDAEQLDSNLSLD